MKNTTPISRGPAGNFLGWRKLAFCLFVLTVATAASAGFRSSIIVFGDSVSDTGRLFRLTDGGFPPRVAYFEGRESNGPVWVEYLAEDLCHDQKLKNYAVVGAMTGPSLAVPSGNVWSDTFPGLERTSLRGQLGSFLCDVGDRFDKEALYIVEGGANDLIAPISELLMNPPASLQDFFAAVDKIARPTAANIRCIVEKLKKRGARHIAVVNVPDFGKAPRLIAFGARASATVSTIVEMVNEAVAGGLDGLDAGKKHKTARIDMFGFVDAVAADPAHFGLTNVTDHFMTLDFSTGTVTLASAAHDAAEQWLFWDDLHPTTRGHELFSDSALKTLQAAFPDLCKDHRDHDDDHGDDDDDHR